jgi:hypothetical protein
MKSTDLRKEITRTIRQVPDIFLEDILNYLKQIEKKSQDDLDSLHYIRKILREDHDLLEKLAR